ncbi:Electron transport complex protein RnfD [hydrothermal vent metagenome]|uniref:Electron transport complex protein RnfD n=1 Tax=hydrothermal vent metagenome TaxID=652676 RepID=A0A1W1CQ82_9ZZZZ
MTTNQLMRQVIYALMLGVITSFYFYGWSVLLQIELAIFSALFFEFIILKIRKKPYPIKTIFDGSAIITALLLALAIPSIAPWWIIIIGSFFAIVFGKQLYGGLGHNPFNPAMLAYAFLLISFPVQMTQWQSDVFMPFIDSFNIIYLKDSIDTISSATQLESLKTHYGSSFFINLSFLIGGIYLFLRKVIYWHIPVAFLSSLILFAWIFNLNISFHLFTGATMLGAFFIATDYVSAATTPKGRIIYGFLIGFIIVIIRKFGNYPDGVAFAILLANICVPLIDYYTRPKVFGSL